MLTNQAVCIIIIDGHDVTSTFMELLISVRVSDKAGTSSDTVSIELDDTDGRCILPDTGAEISVKMGWPDRGVGEVFRGKVDEVKTSGSRSGRTMSIEGKGFDTKGKAKQPQRQHFSDTTVGDALKKAGKTAGIEVKVDDEIANIKRTYIALDNESLAAFGERMAREVGGTFKLVGNKAVVAKRGGGKNPAGKELPTVTGAWGQNLHSYDITPSLGRPREKKTTVRSFDMKQSKWIVSDADTGTDDAETTAAARFSEPDQDTAKGKAKADAEEKDRDSGAGTVTIEGNIGAQPEGKFILSGCRPGVDGEYLIDGVDHEYSTSGFITSLELKRPKGDAGKDKRGKKGSGKSGADKKT